MPKNNNAELIVGEMYRCKHLGHHKYEIDFRELGKRNSNLFYSKQNVGLAQGHEEPLFTYLFCTPTFCRTMLYLGLDKTLVLNGEFEGQLKEKVHKFLLKDEYVYLGTKDYRFVDITLASRT